MAQFLFRTHFWHHVMFLFQEHDGISFSKQNPGFIKTWPTSAGTNVHVYTYTKYRWSLQVIQTLTINNPVLS